jgi:hypothetical protein
VRYALTGGTDDSGHPRRLTRSYLNAELALSSRNKV